MILKRRIMQEINCGSWNHSRHNVNHNNDKLTLMTLATFYSVKEKWVPSCVRYVRSLGVRFCVQADFTKFVLAEQHLGVNSGTCSSKAFGFAWHVWISPKSAMQTSQFEGRCVSVAHPAANPGRIKQELFGSSVTGFTSRWRCWRC